MKDFQKKLSKFQLNRDNLLIISSIIFAVLIFIILADIYSRFWIWQNAVLVSPVKKISLAAYPELSKKSDPDITAQAAVAIDDNSKTVLFSKNINLLFSMASTTKIMTALVALNYFKPTDILTVYSDNVEPVVVGFAVGEKLYFKDILYAMLLPSGNDAALAIAQNYPGGEKAFIGKMNEKAKSLNLINTHFEDSTGLSDNNYSTALELSRLASAALQNKTFSEIVATKMKIITDVSDINTYKLLNIDQLLGKDGITGVKTGYTQEAGGVLITSQEAGGKRFIIVVMKSQDRFLDIEKILSQIDGNITFVSTHP